MFCNKPKNASRNVPGKKNRKRKKKNNQTNQCNHQADNKVRKFENQFDLAQAMSDWAQNFTAANAWQLKHQIAYWKSRAIALRHENKVLHDLVREAYLRKQADAAQNNICDAEDAVNSENSEDSDNENQSEDGDEENEDEEQNDEGDGGNEDLEVSEEFIEFLKENAKYKEAARKEKEKLKAKDEADQLEALKQEEKFESSEEKRARMVEMYGEDWEKILALETSMLSMFISESDKDKPEYWPNIPFNFDAR